MEFIFDFKTLHWYNQKTTSNECVVVYGNTRIPIPNFYETAKDFMKSKNWDEQEHEVFVEDSKDLVPGIREYGGPSRHCAAMCEITSGEWSTNDYVCNNAYLHLHILVAHHENTQLRKRMEKLESVFDHIREKSSILDEFLRVAEEASK
jgi:hypothetical protein